jgi:hypothetical protein
MIGKQQPKEALKSVTQILGHANSKCALTAQRARSAVRTIIEMCKEDTTPGYDLSTFHQIVLQLQKDTVESIVRGHDPDPSDLEKRIRDAKERARTATNTRQAQDSKDRGT